MGKSSVFWLNLSYFLTIQLFVLCLLVPKREGIPLLFEEIASLPCYTDSNLLRERNLFPGFGCESPLCLPRRIEQITRIYPFLPSFSFYLDGNRSTPSGIIWNKGEKSTEARFGIFSVSKVSRNFKFWPNFEYYNLFD